MFNPNHQHYTEYHTRDMRREADERRLAHFATYPAHHTNPILRRMMTAVGQQMIESGRALLARGEAERAETPEWEYFGRVLS